MVDSDNYLDNNYVKEGVTLLQDSGKDIAYYSLKFADTGNLLMMFLNIMRIILV